MYLFENCPFEVDSSPKECTCFDPTFQSNFKRPPDIVHHFCRGDFRGCPYYTTLGVSSRIPEEAKPKVLFNTSGEAGALRGSAISPKERKA